MRSLNFLGDFLLNKLEQNGCDAAPRSEASAPRASGTRLSPQAALGMEGGSNEVCSFKVLRISSLCRATLINERHTCAKDTKTGPEV